VSSLTIRALMVIGLIAGFYILALAIAAGLLFIPYTEAVYGGRIHFRLAIFCIIGAILIILAVIPHRSHFKAPGLSLDSEKQPEIFKLISEMAQKTQQKLPSEVFLTADLNAGVFEYGGFWGLKSRRVLLIGLPLLQVLNVTELRSVIAHEFGHYFKGDTKLGPWVYKTRSAILRTVAALSQHSNFIQTPFILYGKIFLRITHGISRHQEYTADRLAAEIIGKTTVIETLQKIQATSLAFSDYWVSEVIPVLTQGYRPSITEGFQYYLNSTRYKEIVEPGVRGIQTDMSSCPYDTHPTLKERVAALNILESSDIQVDATPSLNLINDYKELETRLLTGISEKIESKELKPIKWEEVGTQVWLPIWSEYIKERNQVFSQITPKLYPVIVKDPVSFIMKLPSQDNPESFTPENQSQVMTKVLGIALAVGMGKDGWDVKTLPGMDVILHRDNLQFYPFRTVLKLNSREILPESWCEMCDKFGISNIKLWNI
jgi:heat shock protein HtpX